MSLSVQPAYSALVMGALASPNAGVAEAIFTLRHNPRAKVTISDTADQISRHFDALARWSGNITGLTVSDAGNAPPGLVQVSAAQFRQNAKLIAKFTDNAIFNVSQSSASYASTLENHAKVATFNVKDTSGDISSRWSVLNQSSKLAQVNVTTPVQNLTLTEQQLNDFSDLLDKFQGPFGLMVNQTAAASAASLKNDARVRSLAILDSAANISASLNDLVDLGAKLQVIRSTDRPLIEVNADRLESNALVIGKIYRGYELSVKQASLSQAAPLVSNRKLASIEVVDTAANIAAHLDTLAKLGSDLTSIHITDTSNHLQLSSDDYQTYASVLAKIQADDDYQVDLTEASVQEAQILGADTRVSKISVSDTAGMISANLATLASNDKIDQIYTLGKSKTIQVAYAQLDQNAALAKITNDYALSVTGVAAGDAKALVDTQPRVVDVSVTGAGSDIIGTIGDLTGLGKKLSSIELSDGNTPLDLTASTWMRHIGTLSKIKNGYAVNVSQVSASKALALGSDARVSSLSVKDTAAAISSQLDALHQLGARLSSITQSDAGAISITGRQYAQQSSTLSKLGADAQFNVRKALVNQATALSNDDQVKQVSIEDSSANLSNGIDDLQAAITANAQRAWALRSSTEPVALQLTQTQYLQNTDALNAMGGKTKWIVNDLTATANNLSKVSADTRVQNVNVKSNSTELSAQMAALVGLGDKLKNVTQTDANTSISMTAANWGQYQSTMAKWVGGAQVGLTAVKAGAALKLASDWRVKTLAIQDSLSAITLNLDALQSIATQVTEVRPSNAGMASVRMSQWTANAAILSKFHSSITLAVTEASATDAQSLLLAANDQLVQIHVKDTGAQIISQLADLASNTKLQSIRVTDANIPIALTATQWFTRSDVLAKIQGNVQFSVTGASVSQLSAAPNGLVADARVKEIGIQDNASDVVSGLNILQGANARITSLSLKDTDTLTLSYAQWRNNQAVLSKIFQNHNLVVQGVSADEASLVGRSPHVATVQVSDTASKVASNMDALQLLGDKLSAITTTDATANPAMRLSAEQVFNSASTLAKISNANYSLSVTKASVGDFLQLQGNGKVSLIEVADTSAQLADNLATLAGSSALSTLTQTGQVSAMELSASDYLGFSTTLAKITNAYTVRLSDATVAQSSALNADSKVLSLTVSDTSQHISNALLNLSSLAKISGFDITQDNGPIQVPLAKLDDYADLRDLLRDATGSPHRIAVTQADVASVNGLLQLSDVDLVSITDSSDHLSLAYADLYPKTAQITGITLDDASVAISITHQQWMNQPELLQKISQPYTLKVNEVSATNATSVSTAQNVVGIRVKDTASAISLAFDDLVTLGDEVLDVQVTDNGDIDLTQAQATTGSALMDRILGEHAFNIT